MLYTDFSRTLSNSYDGVLLQKWLISKSRYVFSRQLSIIYALQGPEYVSALMKLLKEELSTTNLLEHDGVGAPFFLKGVTRIPTKHLKRRFSQQ